MRLLPHEILKITGQEYQKLNKSFLGIDISARNVMPVTRGVYYVDASDPMGRALVTDNTPARCVYATGEIFCLRDRRVPLTCARLIHEFVHRCARRRVAFIMTSGLDINRGRTLLNEVLTEYLTRCILQSSYDKTANPHNLYIPYLPLIDAIVEETGLVPVAKAYLNGNIRFFKRFSRQLSLIW